MLSKLRYAGTLLQHSHNRKLIETYRKVSYCDYGCSYDGYMFAGDHQQQLAIKFKTSISHGHVASTLA